MKQITINLYEFDELSKEAKEKAVSDAIDINVNYDWWDGEYDDAANVGIKIIGFDIGRGDECRGKFIEDALYTANKIKEEHGETCETWKTATTFLRERDALIDKYENNEAFDKDELDDDLNKLEEQFLNEILEDYLNILRTEYEYRTSDEAIIEAINGNEYNFTEDGRIYKH